MNGSEGSRLAKSNQELPLFVDVDGTLIRSDLSFEAFIAFLKINPLYIFRFLFWLLKGRSYAKHQVAKRIVLNLETQPIFDKLLTFLRSEKDSGRKLYLASASEIKYIEPLAKRIGIFDGVIAGQGGPNLSGKNKLQAILQFTGGAPFAYAGNSKIDIDVWNGASQVIVVSQSLSFIKKIEDKYRGVISFYDKPTEWAFLKSLRPHQWSKNLLLLLPICLAHQIGNIELLLQALTAFVAFSLSASAVYLFNDLCDIDSDRAHAIKRNRPLASGDLSVKQALILVPLLLICAAILSLTLPLQFGSALIIYLVATSLYSIKLKELPVVDIVVLALLYTIRIVAGGKATNIIVSQWLMSFSLFLFLSLACLKRYSELFSLAAREPGANPKGRGYLANDKDIISQLGASSGYLSLLVLVLYINSKEVSALYSHWQYLWLLCPLVLYWITRAWLLAHRGEVNQDPVVFALTDRVSYMVMVGMILIIVLAL